MKICNWYFQPWEHKDSQNYTGEIMYNLAIKKADGPIQCGWIFSCQGAVCNVLNSLCFGVFTTMCSVRHAERSDLPCLPVASFVLFTAQRGIPTRSSFISTIFCFYLEQLHWIFFISYFCFLLYLCWIFLMFSFCWSPLLGTTSPSNFNSFLLIQNHAKPKQNQPCYMKANY